MTNKLYSMFRVYDYKGGELSSSLNLTEREIARKLIESDLVFYKDKYDISELYDLPLEEALEATKHIQFAEFELYAGGGDPVGEIYSHDSDGKLSEADLEDFRDVIIEVLTKELKDNQN